MLHPTASIATLLPLLLSPVPLPQGTGRMGGVVGQPCATSLRDTAGGGCLTASSVPALGRLFPLSNDFFIDAATGNIGVGTTFPGSRVEIDEIGAAPISVTLRVANDSAGGWTIWGQNQGTGSALRGLCQSAFGSGCAGSADDGGGAGWFLGTGLSGSTGLLATPFGPVSGVAGWAINPLGVDSGVYGRTDSDSDGVGVLGSHTAATGLGAGVEGQSASKDAGAIGVLGRITQTTPGSFSTAVRGMNSGAGAAGIGVWGSQDGSGWGVCGTVSGSGRAVYGTAPAAGAVGVYGSGGLFGVFSAGDFGGTGAKYFVQPHPERPEQEIRLVCLEGNESGTYFRGSAELSGGWRVIDVPEEFRLTTDPQGLTVQVTARGPARLWVEEAALDGIVVRGDADVSFDYFVNGVRRGFGNHRSIQANRCFVPTFRGVPFGAELRPEVRQMLVDNGTLHADFTPNEATATRLGWELRDSGEAAELASTGEVARPPTALPRGTRE